MGLPDGMLNLLMGRGSVCTPLLSMPAGVDLDSSSIGGLLSPFSPSFPFRFILLGDLGNSLPGIIFLKLIYEKLCLKIIKKLFS